MLNLSLFDSDRATSRGRVAIKTRDLESLPAELAPALDTLVSGVLAEAGWGPSVAQRVTPADEGSLLVGVVLPWGLIGAGALVTTTGVVTDLLLPTSANGALDGGDFIGPAVMALGIGAVGTGAALLFLDPFAGSP